jgi:hypothetical protein
LAGTARVIDGDTLSIADTRIRLWGIDAPERDQTCQGKNGDVYECGRDRGPRQASRIGRLYRGALFALSDDGVTVDHVLGAANHRLLREDETLIRPLIRTKWL